MYHILYVDDEPGLLEIGKLFLEEGGEFSVDIVPSAPAALALLTSGTYHAIISDYQMPGMDGIEFLKTIREPGNTIPFILFTGRGREEVVIQAINAGVDFYLQKGGDPKAQFAELRLKVRQSVKRRQTEEALNESERRFRELADLLPQGIYEARTDGTLTYVNYHALEMFGYTDEDMRKGLNAMAMIAPGDRQKATQAFRAIADAGSIPHADAEYLALRKDGTIFNIAIFSSPVLRNGRIAGIRGILMDITGRKRAEAELRVSYEQIAAADEKLRIQYNEMARHEQQIRESEQRYRNVVEDQTEFICRFTPEGTHVFVNDAYCRYFGLKRDEIVGHRFRPKIPAEDQERVKRLFASLSPDHPVDNIDHRIIMPDGSIRWQRWSDRAIYDNAGNLIEYQSVGRDLTEQMQAEEAFRSFVQESPSGITLMDEEGRVIEWNEAMARISGIPRREALGKSQSDLLESLMVPEHRTPDRIRHFHASLEEARLTGTSKYFSRPVEAEIYCRDGKRRIVQQITFPIRTSKGFRIGAIAHDITDRYPAAVRTPPGGSIP